MWVMMRTGGGKEARSQRMRSQARGLGIQVTRSDRCEKRQLMLLVWHADGVAGGGGMAAVCVPPSFRIRFQISLRAGGLEEGGKGGGGGALSWEG